MTCLRRSGETNETRRLTRAASSLFGLACLFTALTVWSITGCGTSSSEEHGKHEEEEHEHEHEDGEPGALHIQAVRFLKEDACQRQRRHAREVGRGVEPAVVQGGVDASHALVAVSERGVCAVLAQSCRAAPARRRACRSRASAATATSSRSSRWRNSDGRSPHAHRSRAARALTALPRSARAVLR